MEEDKECLVFAEMPIHAHSSVGHAGHAYMPTNTHIETILYQHALEPIRPEFAQPIQEGHSEDRTFFSPAQVHTCICSTRKYTRDAAY
jgi:hypothetical protein